MPVVSGEGQFCLRRFSTAIPASHHCLNCVSLQRPNIIGIERANFDFAKCELHEKLWRPVEFSELHVKAS